MTAGRSQSVTEGVRLPQRQLLADDVYETVKALLMDHSIAPGARLSIDGIARDLQVSQTPIRETLARLESEGLVTKEPLRGYFATDLLGAEELHDLYELRMLIEPWAAGRAAERAGKDDVDRLEAELGSCPVAPAGTEYSDYRLISAHDTRFHDLVAEIAGNSHVRDAFTRTHAHLHLFRLSYGQDFGSEALREHRDIVRAIAAGSPERAEQEMRAHLVAARERLLPAVG